MDQDTRMYDASCTTWPRMIFAWTSSTMHDACLTDSWNLTANDQSLLTSFDWNDWEDFRNFHSQYQQTPCICARPELCICFNATQRFHMASSTIWRFWKHKRSAACSHDVISYRLAAGTESKINKLQLIWTLRLKSVLIDMDHASLIIIVSSALLKTLTTSGILSRWWVISGSIQNFESFFWKQCMA